jgi:hypothetical protein
MLLVHCEDYVIAETQNGKGQDPIGLMVVDN